MSAGLSADDEALLREDPPRRGRPPRRPETPPPEAVDVPEERGPITPAQYEDDGWGTTPVQMRH